MKTFTIIVDGIKGSGKTSYINRLLLDQFSEEYIFHKTIATLGPLQVYTNYGYFILNFIDLPQNYDYQRNIKVDGLFFMITPSSTKEEIISKKIQIENMGVPSVLCINKCHENKKCIEDYNYLFPKVCMSVKTCLNLYQPILKMIKILLKKEDVAILYPLEIKKVNTSKQN